MKEQSYEQLGYWICIAILTGFALVSSLGIANYLSTGQVRTFTKGSVGRLVVKTSDPVGFYLALVPYVLILGILVYGVYWVWTTYLRKL